MDTNTRRGPGRPRTNTPAAKLRRISPAARRHQAAQDRAEVLRIAFRDRLLEARAEGASLRELSEHAGVSHQRIAQIVGK